jgi:hypothetical protein
MAEGSLILKPEARQLIGKHSAAVGGFLGAQL